MIATHKYNHRICTALAELGIAHSVHGGIILVDRTSMVNASPRTIEADAYGCVLDLLEELCPEATWIGWSGRTDEYLGLEVYQ